MADSRRELRAAALRARREGVVSSSEVSCGSSSLVVVLRCVHTELTVSLLNSTKLLLCFIVFMTGFQADGSVQPLSLLKFGRRPISIGSNKQRQATRVFKKSSPNGKITVYLWKRDFVDHITHVDPIDRVVLIDPEYVKDRKVFGHVLAAFRYGREDLDVLGLTFRKDLYLAAGQIPT